jgi:hypothetical protein
MKKNSGCEKMEENHDRGVHSQKKKSITKGGTNSYNWMGEPMVNEVKMEREDKEKWRSEGGDDSSKKEEERGGAEEGGMEEIVLEQCWNPTQRGAKNQARVLMKKKATQGE